jgi:hypothetical protein
MVVVMHHHHFSNFFCFASCHLNHPSRLLKSRWDDDLTRFILQLIIFADPV